MKHTPLILGLALACGAGAASATVEVRFVEPAKYSDVRNNFGFDRSEDVLKDIQQHFRELGDKELPGKDLLIEVTDVDLAGSIEPVGRNMEMLRVMRSTGRPAIRLRYVLRENGRDLRSAEVRLSDLSYQDGMNRYSSSDPIRYEKRMMDDWFRREFLADVQTVGKLGR